MPNDLWEILASHGNRAKEDLLELLEHGAAEQGGSEQVRRFFEAAHEAVSTAATTTFPADILTKCTAGAQELSKETGRVLAGVFENVHEDVPSPEAFGHLARRAGDAIAQMLVGCGLSETAVKEHLVKLVLHIEHLINLAGNFVEEHPVLSRRLVIAVAILLAMRFLGQPLAMLGFGIRGPIKGTFAPRAQRSFYGPAVPRGSWFARLQSAAMRPVASGWWIVVAAGGVAALSWFGDSTK